ncbi:hypothetical protein [Streptomyces albipurpureus]|uniref:PASTA domain-containing protein n=1 Tax=Streptomyces albipurpureus TaxID=2897419 RepID=A0ABT0UVK5_9ACTN|nr:hypothetical protein [Streptomyces sp. CWNU-1]MCM2391675.1 hypothetical protein [Streptomyces sp. CWNU-1]
MTYSQQPQQPPTGPQWGQPPAQPPTKQPSWARKRIVIPAAALLFFIGVGIGSSGSDSKETAGSGKAAAPTVTATVTVKPVDGTGKGAKAAVDTATEPAPQKTKESRAEESESKAVPRFVGMGLQDAQDSAQAAGFHILTSHDSTGASRMQVLDRNWKVCTQNYPEGKTMPLDTELNFGAVKVEETCP